MARGRFSGGVTMLAAVLAGCEGDGGGGDASGRLQKDRAQPLDRVVVSTPGNWTEIREIPTAAPPREVTSQPADPAEELQPITIRSRLSVMDVTGSLLGDEFLPRQELRSGETRRVMLGDATDGAEVVFELRSLREGEALLRVGLRMWGRRAFAQTWMTRLDGSAGQTFQAAARGGTIVRLDLAADGIPQRRVEEQPTASVLEELRRRQPPPPVPAEPR